MNVAIFPAWRTVSRSALAGTGVVVEMCEIGGDQQLYRAMVEAGTSEVALSQPEAKRRLADKLDAVVKALRG